MRPAEGLGEIQPTASGMSDLFHGQEAPGGTIEKEVQSQQFWDTFDAGGE